MPPMWQTRLLVFKGLHEKSQVKAIAKRLVLSVDEVAGVLLRVWFKFQDAASAGGKLAGKSAEWLDITTGHDGFAESMAAAGWLTIEPDGLTVVNFDEFISKSAVRRQENTIRKAQARADCADRDEGNRDNLGTTSGQPRDKVPVPTPARVVLAARQRKPKGGSSLGSPLFDRFWAAYPRKEAKTKAAEAFWRAEVDEAKLGRILAAIERQAKSEAWRKDGGQFIPHPATWLNGRRWEDEVGAGPGHGGGVQPLGRVQSPAGKYANLKRHFVADATDPPKPDPDHGRGKPPTSLFPDEDP